MSAIIGLVSAVLGACVGTKIGIAVLGTAIRGTIPAAVLFGVLGGTTHRALSSRRSRRSLF